MTGTAGFCHGRAQWPLAEGRPGTEHASVGHGAHAPSAVVIERCDVIRSWRDAPTVPPADCGCGPLTRLGGLEGVALRKCLQINGSIF